MGTSVTWLTDLAPFGTGHVGNSNCALAANLEKMWSQGPAVPCPCPAWFLLLAPCHWRWSSCVRIVLVSQGLPPPAAATCGRRPHRLWGSEASPGRSAGPRPGHCQCLLVEEKAVPLVPARTTFLTCCCSLALRRVRPARGTPRRTTDPRVYREGGCSRQSLHRLHRLYFGYFWVGSSFACFGRGLLIWGFYVRPWVLVLF